MDRLGATNEQMGVHEERKHQKFDSSFRKPMDFPQERVYERTGKQIDLFSLHVMEEKVEVVSCTTHRGGDRGNSGTTDPGAES